MTDVITIETMDPGRLSGEMLGFWRERLIIQDEISAFISGPEWFAMMAEERTPPAVVLSLRDAEGLRIVLPLLFMDREFVVAPGKAGRRSIRVAKVCGGDLVENGTKPLQLHHVWKRIAELHPEIDAIWFDHVASEKRMRKIEESCMTQGEWFVHRLHSAMPHYRLVLPGTVEEFRRLRSPASFRRLKSYERALGSRVRIPCKLVEMRSRSDLLPYSDRIVKLMSDTWQARLLGHSFSLDDLNQVAGKGWLRAFLLLAGDDTVAFAACYQGGETLVYETPGYDQAFAAYSPGTILLHRIIEHVYSENMPKYFDFGEGEAAYKSRLANDVIHIDSCLVAKKNLRLAGLLGLYSLRRHMGRVGRALLDKVGLRQRLVSRAKKGRRGTRAQKHA